MISPLRTLPILVSLALAAPALAQSGPNQWSEPPGIPGTVYIGGSIVSTDSDTLYVLRGNYSTDFYKYTISTGSWSAMAPLPNLCAYGGAMTFMPGTNHIYATRGYNSTDFYRYDIVANSWSAMAAFPQAATYGVSLAATTTKVYAFGGGNTTNFHEYTPDAGTGTWAPKAAVPLGAYIGAALTYPGSGDFVYGMRGYNSTNFYRYSISGNSWTAMAAVPLAVYYGGALCPGPSSTLYAFRGYNSTSFYRYDIAGNSWTTLAATPATVSYGAGLAWPGTGTTVYCMRGNSSTDFWRYSIPGNNFISTLPNTPSTVSYGGFLTGVGNGNDLYAFQGNNSLAFWKYSISAGAWSTLASAPLSVGYGGSLAHTGGDDIFAARGNYSNVFWKYSISGNSWTTLAAMPNTLTYGGQIVYGGGDYIYAMRGYYTTDYWRYSISNNSWEVMSPTPAAVSSGGALVYPGTGDRIYAFGGGGTTAFWYYSMGGDSWTPLSACLENAGYGASLCYPGSGNTIFAFSGNGGQKFLAYDIAADSWSYKADAPASEGWGSSLAYPGTGKYIYALRGNGTSAFWRYWIDSQAPAVPASMTQLRLDGVTTVAQGATVPEPGLKFRATCTDPDANGVKLQVEVVPMSGSFSGTPTVESPFMASGTTITVTVLGLADDSYKWQARVVDMTDASSTWTEFGAASADFVVSTPANSAPGNPTLGPSGTTEGQFRLDGTTVIPIGAMTNQKGVVLKGVATDPNGNSWRLEVEVKLTAQALNGTGTVLGDFAQSGQSASTTVNNLGDGNYHWRARAVDSSGATSSWVSFDGSDGTTDFSVLVNVNPNAPTLLDQIRTATGLPIPIGGGSYEGNVTFQGTVSDPNVPDTVKLQVEVKPVGTSFDGTGLNESALVANGTVASVPVTGLTASTSYHWRARCMDNNGSAGPWVSFGGNLESQNDFTVTAPPNDPTVSGPGALNQYKFDQTTVIPVGGSTPENAFVIKGTVSDPDGNDVRLQIELRATSLAWTGAYTHQSGAVASGEVAVVTLSSLANNTYHWRARCIEDASGVVSNWVVFGGNSDGTPPTPPADTDVQIAAGANSAPNAPPTTGPNAMTQYWYDGVTVVPVGGITSDPGVIVKTVITDPNAGTTLRLQVECKATADPFDGTGTIYSPYVLTGSPVQVKIDNATTTGEIYHWRARTQDSAGAYSAWVSFGGNLETQADFQVVINNPPSAPTFLNQGKVDDVTAIPVGGSVSEPAVRFACQALDSDGDPVQFEIEIKLISVPFDGSSTYFTEFVASGATAFYDVVGIANGSYHWRARAKDIKGKVGPWAAFGGNVDNDPSPPPSDTDFVVSAPGTSANPNDPTSLGPRRRAGCTSRARSATPTRARPCAWRSSCATSTRPSAGPRRTCRSSCRPAAPSRRRSRPTASPTSPTTGRPGPATPGATPRRGSPTAATSTRLPRRPPPTPTSP
jgi:hypothetical protein